MSGGSDPAQQAYDAKHVLGDPEDHAQSLVEKLGSQTAFLLADCYARDWPASCYWAQVLAAVRNRPQTPGPRSTKGAAPKKVGGARRFLGTSWPGAPGKANP